jgi:predicted XRE-type DNA-binding protein
MRMGERTQATRRRNGGEGEESAVRRVGSNIFDDLGRPNAAELLAKVELARAIRRLIEARGLTQAEAAAILGIAQPDVSNLGRARLAGFSIERLCRFLNLLGQDVRIVVTPKPRSRARATLRATVRAA